MPQEPAEDVMDASDVGSETDDQPPATPSQQDSEMTPDARALAPVTPGTGTATPSGTDDLVKRIHEDVRQQLQEAIKTLKEQFQGHPATVVRYLHHNACTIASSHTSNLQGSFISSVLTLQMGSQ